MIKRTSAALVLAWAAAATVAQAQQVTFSTPFTPGLPASAVYTDSLTIDASAPTFQRPIASGTELSPTVPSSLSTGAFPYRTSTFTPSADGLYDFFSAQAFDGYLLLYGSFDPSNPLENVLAGDDDMSSLNGGSVPNRNGIPTSEDSGFRYFLTSGFTYTLVSTTFSATVPANGAVYNEIRTLPTPSEPNYPIPDAPSGGTTPGEPFSLDLVISSENTGTIESFDSLKITSLTHTWVSDLVITLTHVESGTTVDLLDRAGKTTATGVGNSDDLSGDYTFVDGGPALDTSGTTIPGGTYGTDPNAEFGSSAANGTLASFNGLPIAGTWRLTFQDYLPADVGTFSAFTITATLADGTPDFTKGDFGGGESSDGSFNTPDGAFNELDVEGFLLALNDSEAYLTLNAELGPSLAGRGDFGGNESTDGSFNTPDGAFNELDVEGFLLALNDPAGYAAIQPAPRLSPIPEPAALGLLAPMGLLLARRRR